MAWVPYADSLTASIKPPAPPLLAKCQVAHQQPPSPFHLQSNNDSFKSAGNAGKEIHFLKKKEKHLVVFVLGPWATAEEKVRGHGWRRERGRRMNHPGKCRHKSRTKRGHAEGVKDSVGLSLPESDAHSPGSVNGWVGGHVTNPASQITTREEKKNSRSSVSAFKKQAFFPPCIHFQRAPSQRQR